MPYILSLATESAPYCFLQNQIADSMLEGLPLSFLEQKTLRALYLNSAIQTRRFILPSLPSLLQKRSTQERNIIYKEQAPKLAIQAARKALSLGSQDPGQITHVISVSCTGMMAPGLEYYLIKELGLPLTVGRIGINFMGCFGAFNALSVATALAKENKKNRILMVCTELCSLHGQADLSSDILLANSLFGDGSAACIVGGEPEDGYLWEIVNRSSMVLKDSAHMMSWDLSDTGFSMTLSNRVPVLIKKNIAIFAKKIVEDKCTFAECFWAIHPGGKSILKAVEKECALFPHQTTSSWEILQDYGNMSSATFLFVLENSLKKCQKWTAGVAFGPGLSMEGVLLRR